MARSSEISPLPRYTIDQRIAPDLGMVHSTSYAFVINKIKKSDDKSGK